VAAELGDLEGVAVGIGVVAAAIGTTRAILQRRPSRVILVGTAGVFPGRGLAVGTAVSAARIGMGCIATETGVGYQPQRLETYDGEGTARVLTNHAITTDPGLAEAWGRAWDLEHMEAWGVASACAALGVRWEVALGISNRVGPNAHVEWRANRTEAEEAARRLVRQRR
jgi:purine-nucleoside phosphorylase